VLYSKLKALNEGRRFFTIAFGYQAKTHREAIIDMIANQVQNLHHGIEKVVIPVGSGVSSCGIIEGLKRFRPDILEREYGLILIQPFGYDRTSDILSGVDFEFGQGFKYYKGAYPYSKPLRISVDGVDLDNIYESKAYDYMVKHNLADNKTCFWVVGDSNYLRT
jgi:hypothetical protein